MENSESWPVYEEDNFSDAGRFCLHLLGLTYLVFCQLEASPPGATQRNLPIVYTLNEA